MDIQGEKRQLGSETEKPISPESRSNILLDRWLGESNLDALNRHQQILIHAQEASKLHQICELLDNPQALIDKRASLINAVPDAKEDRQKYIKDTLVPSLVVTIPMTYISYRICEFMFSSLVDSKTLSIVATIWALQFMLSKLTETFFVVPKARQTLLDELRQKAPDAMNDTEKEAILIIKQAFNAEGQDIDRSELSDRILARIADSSESLKQEAMAHEELFYTLAGPVNLADAQEGVSQQRTF